MTAKDSIENYREVTEAEKTALEKSDAAWVEPPKSFIDQWNTACGSHGRYNEATGFFKLNGLTDITYEEAVTIYVDSSPARVTNYLDAAFCNSRMRTNLPFLTLTKSEQGLRLQSAFRECPHLQVVNLQLTNKVTRIVGHLSWIFQAPKLKKILGVLEFVDQSPFGNGTPASLEEIQITNLKQNIGFRACSRLSLPSLRYMVDHASNGSAITIAVHPDVFAKLTDSSNTEWSALMTLAAEKNISFVSA